jgi:hypothetical protein
MQLSSSSGAKMTDIKEIGQEIIKERGKKFCSLYGLEYVDAVKVDITDKVRKNFNFLEDIFVPENDFELAVNQLCHALVVMREDDEMFPSMTFLHYVYEWDVKDYFFEWIQTSPIFLLKAANIAM